MPVSVISKFKVLLVGESFIKSGGIFLTLRVILPREVNFAAFVTMFPQIVAGPIVRYDDIESEIDNRKMSY